MGGKEACAYSIPSVCAHEPAHFSAGGKSYVLS